ncbi:endolytic transglycosylase MltG [Streptomyces sp. NPDC029004]|uniref:endolytic transglycosylase MltG n=1 Tax=Streptomyces sp. NPDC029004 TaxID=3154490 RepID=UPI00340285C1
MTEYGRGSGSEPWHPEDPLYGDQGWGGQQAEAGQTPYGGQPQQQYPQQPQQYGNQQQDPYQQQQQYNQQQQQQQYNQQQQQQYNQQQYNGGWDTGQQPAMPYGAGPADTYGGQQPGYANPQEADYYATPEAYPPPEPPGRRQAQPQPAPTDWDAEAQQEETHPFFTGDDDRDDDGEYDDDPGESRRGAGRERRGKTKTKKKSRNGCACLVVSLVLAGGLGGAGYFGYQFWQERFGPAEDYAGAGTGQTQVEIPKGAGLLEIGNILKTAGVVKSAGAFVAAADGKGIQAGVYLLPKGMSGKNAVARMLDPASRNNLMVIPGKRNSWVYEQIDARLGIKAGTTKAVAKAKAKTLGLPEWANDNKNIKDPLEGFLYPATYPVAKGMKPEAVLQKMVAQANKEFSKRDLKAEAARLGLKTPLQVITVASLVQAEGKYKHDFDKVSRVVYNRLKPNNIETVGRLEFDSTINYIKSESKLDTGAVDDLRQIKDPYNTYDIKGLPPGPIGNPGLDAFGSALNPTPGPWYYFVSITEDKTLFAVTNAEHERNRRKYEEQQEKNGQ